MISLNEKSTSVFIVACLMLTFVFGMVGAAGAATIYVEEGESIQDAIDNASPEDTIEVGPGTFVEQLTIGESKANLSLIGATDGNGVPNSVLNLSTFTCGHGILIKGVEGVTVKNFEVHHSPDRGVYADKTQGVLIDNIVTHNNSNDGIRVREDQNGTVQNSKSIENNGDGITFYSYGSILNNIVSNNVERGIYVHVGSVTGTGTLTISCNEVYENENAGAISPNEHKVGGIIVYSKAHVLGITQVIIENNKIYKNKGPGLLLYKINHKGADKSVIADSQSESLVKGNIIFDNENRTSPDWEMGMGMNPGDGILVYLCHNIVFECNVIYNSTAGIRITNDYRYNSFGPTTNNTLRFNDFYNNEYGILVSGGDNYGVKNTTAHENNIYGNVNGVVNMNNNNEIVNATSNWWGDSSGPSGVGLFGTGDFVSENVDFDPYKSEALDACPPTECPDTDIHPKPNDFCVCSSFASVPTMNPLLLIVGLLGISMFMILRKETKK
ncbi:right-handed parallel beta-helix repeat-containing protein [Methanosalsum natronophilum]|uniref:right-handed parallel beta-helix repeat-containing protein n=1 Tax=Methanosalsum natronophilum TaxID=768733 RepID=UPI00216A00E4|nr:right-handed parallel beta-helix repeat-containing protein [Methanosalsum natronophilum]MCS3924206.1 hypothetical protein [Methanosalsum natronophilum]